MAPDDLAPPYTSTSQQAASGRPIGAGVTTFGAAAERLVELGYEPLPIVPGQKYPALRQWSTIPVDAAAVERWRSSHASCGVGLRTGRLAGIDIDVLDPDLAYQVMLLTEARFGSTLIRIGRFPKRLLLYRTSTPFPKLKAGPVEILGAGQQFVAFGLHPETGHPYDWPDGDTPLDVALEDLPAIDAAVCQDFLSEAAALLPPAQGASRPRTRGGITVSAAHPVRDSIGLVMDGRDGWLSSIAFHAVHDAHNAGAAWDAGSIAQRVWERFCETADLSRPRGDGACPYGFADAARKVSDKLRLLLEGRLPSRSSAEVDATYVAPALSVEEARTELEEHLQEACVAIEAWYAEGCAGRCPSIGIRATVGLGKSAVSRRHLQMLRRRLRAMGAPSRLVVLTSSHRLAEETAAAWRVMGVRTAVLRGYEARHPLRGQPMCADIAAVRLAVEAGLDVHSTACSGTGGRRCRSFEGCLKQENRREVEAADVVVAPYDALFTGFALEPDPVALLVIDEGCWQRAVQDVRLPMTEFDGRSVAGLSARGSKERIADDMAQLERRRKQGREALFGKGSGPLARRDLLRAGLTAEACREAAQLERRFLRDPGLYPGMPESERRLAARTAASNEQVMRVVAVWNAMADLVAGDAECSGRIHTAGSGEEQVILVTGARRIHQNLRGKPILHLDATLRPAIAQAVLPDLDVHVVEAVAPHMQVRLVAGSFGKSTLCQDAHASQDENRRRQNRLADCVDYVRWHARRVAPGRVLVITYKDCEEAFGDIPGVETGHFNAIAGLDVFGDVSLLIVVGRPLPQEAALHPLCGAIFAREPRGGYRAERLGVRMRDGTSRAIRCIRHADEQAEEIRAAICDDEIIQAIGRGRGVNRTAADPLDVHVLADVALPLVHDRVVAWDLLAPDIVQRMLLAGVAVDSPADAALLHPGLLSSEAQAQKAFERAGFRRQNPIDTPYREMSSKHAAYRRAGQGRSWQNAYWIDDDEAAARRALEEALGPLVDWRRR